MADADAENNVEELTVIDGDVLEDTFEEQGEVYDRFTHVIVCDLGGMAIRAVPYIYARNISRVRERMSTVAIDTHPNFKEYAIKDELLQVLTSSPEVLCSLVDKQDNIIPTLYEELVELEQLEMLDDMNAKSLGCRLNAHLKSIRIGKHTGDGIFWLPENYAGDADDIDQRSDEDYDDYMRRAICTHIKCRALPMAHIITMSEDRMNMVRHLVDSLQNYIEVTRWVDLSYFVGINRNRATISTNALKTLMAEEFRCVKNDEVIDGNAVFVFTDNHLDAYEHTIPTTQARDNLRYYVGDFLDELDLSRSFITGSAITASIIKSSREWEYSRGSEVPITASRETIIDLLYPKVITKIASENEVKLRTENINIWHVRAVSESEGLMRKGNETISFTIKSGSDVDIVVDNTVSDEEYRTIAHNHLQVIKQYYPYVNIREYMKPKGDWNYIIYTDDPNLIPVFRTVEIYRSSFRNICSHHVGAVRGCYTSRWSQRAQFYITASALWTSWFTSTPNYHYFAGRKSNPQDIIVKNMLRGINVSDDVLSNLIHSYMREKRIDLAPLPFYRGRNIPYSIFAAPVEYPFIQDELRRKREMEEQYRTQQAERQQRENRRLQAKYDRDQRQQVERSEYLSTLGFPQIGGPTFGPLNNMNNNNYRLPAVPFGIPSISSPQRLPRLNDNLPGLPGLPVINPFSSRHKSPEQT